MTIGVIANEDKDKGFAIARRLADSIHMRGGSAILATQGITSFNGCDVLICIGGDGTLIKVIRETLFFGTPILGVNLGSLGYLTEVEASQIDVMLDRIFNHDYRVEERMMLTITRESGRQLGGRGIAYEDSYENSNDSAYDESIDGAYDESNVGTYKNSNVSSYEGYEPDPSDIKHNLEETAINELAIGRGDEPHVIRLKLYINDTFLDVFPGDGILISTPTGSTAYSLSAGGPVIDPELNAISIVPVCPHVIFSRPVLVAPDKEISIVPVDAATTRSGGILPQSHPTNTSFDKNASTAPGTFRASVSVDGFRGPDLRPGEIIRVRRSKHVTKMLRFNADNFYDVLKNKLFESSYKFEPGKIIRGAPVNG